MLNMLILSIVVATAATVVTRDRSTKVGGRGLRGRLPWLAKGGQSEQGRAGQGRAGQGRAEPYSCTYLTNSDAQSHGSNF